MKLLLWIIISMILCGLKNCLIFVINNIELDVNQRNQKGRQS